MENNIVNAPAGVRTPEDGNLYPNSSWQQPVPVPPPVAVSAVKTKKTNPELMKTTGPAALLYAIFFTFCLYKNPSGITYPFYVAGTVCFSGFIMRKSGISWKKEHVFAPLASLLLGVSTCMTDSAVIIFLNKTLFLFLSLYFLLQVFFVTKGWQLGKFLAAMAELTVGGIGRMFLWIPDIKAYHQTYKKGKNSQFLYVLAGLGISVPLLTIILYLLSSADMVFEKAMGSFFDASKIGDSFNCILWAALIFMLSYGTTVFLSEKKIKEEQKDYRKGQPVIAISATIAIAIIYIYFCVIQVVYLFAGMGTLPEGYTYAQYARQGFFQLLFICLLNLGLVLAGLGFFKESKVLKGILLIISLCTYVMIASSAYRMLLYISVYYLTFLRVFVLWALCVIALLMTGVICKTLSGRFPLFQYGLAVVTCCYLILSFAHVDYWVADMNISHMKVTEEDTALRSWQMENPEGVYTDTWYLNGLSADAAPAIVTKEHVARYRAQKAAEEELKERDLDVFGEEYQQLYNKITEKRPWYYDYMEREYERAEEMNFRTWNFSRAYVWKMMR